jgi:mono/diheme cytochrome c family protein
MAATRTRAVDGRRTPREGWTRSGERDPLSVRLRTVSWTNRVQMGRYNVGLVLVALTGIAHPVLAQNGGAARTTMAGVYTEAQAAKGEQTFASICTGCHTTASHTGPAFMNSWRGYPLSDLFEYLSTSMPKSDPGSLTPAQYVQVMAYILKLNGMPPGETELPAKADALKSIRIDTSKAAGRPAAPTPSIPSRQAVAGRTQRSASFNR